MAIPLKNVERECKLRYPPSDKIRHFSPPSDNNGYLSDKNIFFTNFTPLRQLFLTNFTHPPRTVYLTILPPSDIFSTIFLPSNSFYKTLLTFTPSTFSNGKALRKYFLISIAFGDEKINNFYVFLHLVLSICSNQRLVHHVNDPWNHLVYGMFPLRRHTITIESNKMVC